MIRSRFLRAAWAVVEDVATAVVLTAFLVAVAGGLYVFFGGPQ